MNGFVAGLAALAALSGAAAHAQVQEVGVCEVINHPSKYEGKIVRMKGLVQASFDSLLIKGDSCDNALWLSYPTGTRARSGPTAIVTLQLAANATGGTGTARPALALEKNTDWTQFDTLLSAKPKTPGMCLGCVKNNVAATLTGRVDLVEDAGLVKDADGKVKRLEGFGNLNAYSVRLVLTGVSAVSAQEIDFSKAPKISGDGQGSSDKDFIGLTKKAETAFPAGSDPVAQIQRAIDAFGAPGQDNGVTVGFGGVADVPAGEGAKGAKASPDGILYSVLFDTDKLKGDALSRALAHQGSEVASERDPKPGSYPSIEQAAWQAALLTVIGSRQKSLMLPGGYVLWDESWALPDRSAKAGEALNAFLLSHEAMPH